MRKDRRKHTKYANKWKIAILFLCILGIGLCVWKFVSNEIKLVSGKVTLSQDEINAERPELIVDLLTVNPYSRPGKELAKVKGIVIHYTANPGATAQNNRDYFENLKDTHAAQVSSHFVIGLDGEIVQCIPSWEIAYASNDRNKDTLSIECCHPNESGTFTEETYQSMVQLTAWLCKKFNLTEEDVIRHYDVTGKNCPKYFVENEEEWVQFKEYVRIARSK